ncbi:MAG TPA: FixG Ig-like domain-containing protein, partial [Burkholderiaceae bacterium]
RVLRPRVLIYGAVLVVISVAFLVSLSWRMPLKVDVVRDRATLARLVDEGRIENLYRLQLMNATEQPQRYRIAVQGLAGVELPAADTVELAAAQARWVTLAVRLPPDSARAAGPGAHPIRFQIQNLDKPAVTVSEKSTFIVPR